jgi:hypothetical protein
MKWYYHIFKIKQTIKIQLKKCIRIIKQRISDCKFYIWKLGIKDYQK